MNLRERITAKTGLHCGNIYVDENEITIRPPDDSSMYAEWDVTFDQLSALSELFQTRKINFHHNEGWCGTDVTPGDPAEYYLVVKDATMPKGII